MFIDIPKSSHKRDSLSLSVCFSPVLSPSISTPSAAAGNCLTKTHCSLSLLLPLLPRLSISTLYVALSLLLIFLHVVTSHPSSLLTLSWLSHYPYDIWSSLSSCPHPHKHPSCPSSVLKITFSCNAFYFRFQCSLYFQIVVWWVWLKIMFWWKISMIFWIGWKLDMIYLEHPSPAAPIPFSKW